MPAGRPEMILPPSLLPLIAGDAAANRENGLAAKSVEGRQRFRPVLAAEPSWSHWGLND